MARKVFLSVLGTGFYDKCVYSMGEFRSPQTRFIQEATIRMLTQQSEWTENDHIYIVVTDKAETDNWIVKNNTRTHYKTKQEEEYTGLHDVLAEMNLKTPVSTIKIPDGNNEDEIWQMFENIYNVLQKEDRLFFDLTHAFRYIPMLVLVLGNYAKFLKDIKKESITYGKYDTQDATGQESSIIDITSIATLQDWTYAAADYLNHGDATELKNCAKSRLHPILRQTRGADKSARKLLTISEKVAEFSDLAVFNRGPQIIEGVESTDIQRLIQEVDFELIKPLKPLLYKICDSVDDFSQNSTYNMLLAALQCYKRHNYQSAITLLQEGITTLMCIRHNLLYKILENRDLVKSAFEKRDRIKHPDKGEYKPSSNQIDEDRIDKIANDPILTDDIVSNYIEISKCRNDYNHAGMRDANMSVKTMKSRIKKMIDNAEKLFNEDKLEREKEQSRPALLLNLSNHPYDAWDDAQKQAAQPYGECRDMEFPQVDPTVDTDQIIQMADKYVDEIAEMSRQYDVTVHVMGEMTFTYRVVTRLTALGIRCICSTSRRDTYINDKGDKVVSFHFRRFRDYTA